MIQRSSPATPEDSHFGPELAKPVSKPSDRLRALIGRRGLFKTIPGQMVTRLDAEPRHTDMAPLMYTADSLKQYAEEVGHITLNDMHMAMPIEMLQRLEIPEELTIVQINPDDTAAAADYHTAARQSLQRDHCPTPYVNPELDESNNSYYVGYVTLPGQEPAAAVTLQTTNFGGKGNIVFIDNVSTLEAFRRHNYAGILISTALKDSQYTIAVLHSRPEKAEPFYERLGFLPIE